MNFNKLTIYKIALCIVVSVFSSCQQKNTETNKYKAILSPVEISPKIPVDVNPTIQTKFKDDIYQLNRQFNLFSWQTLIAVNWPLDENGTPRKKFTEAGKPAWLNWKESFEVFRADGAKPKPWNSPRTGGGNMLTADIINDEDTRVLLSNKTPTRTSNINIVNEVDQAFSGKLFDQNGNVVVYEVVMNKEEFDYIVNNKLYNINGQLDFSKTTKNVDLPAGNFEQQKLGAIELKFAWKILEENDHKERYFKDEGYIINEATKKLEKKELGLIGMHIAQKTPTAKQWVWSTFEHIDNLDRNVKQVNGKTIVIHPTLTNPDCEICPVNVDATDGGSTYTAKKTKHGNFWNITGDSLNYYTDDTAVMKTQAKRMIDIPVRVKKINNLMQAYFRNNGSVWQYYQLIDTQYPLNQNAKPAISSSTEYHIPESVTNKSGGKPNIAFLTNISMETFFQHGNQTAGLMENSTSDITIFGTESCIGCHSSASIYKSYIDHDGKLISSKQLSGDFSWLFSNAQWEKGVDKPKK